MSSERKKRAKAGFNIIDYILILLIAVILIFMFFKIKNYKIEPSAAKETKTVTLSVSFTPLRDELRDCLMVGDVVLYDISGNKIGEITGIEYGDYNLIGTNGVSGEEVKTPIDGYLTLDAKLVCDAEITDFGYKIGGKTVTIGETVGIRTARFCGNAVICGIELGETGE